MRIQSLYISTIAKDAIEVTHKTGCGLELAEFCTASNMDAEFSLVRERLELAQASARQLILHGPFNELFPCAVDPMAVQLAEFRYKQSLDFAIKFGANKLILHGGFQPYMYYPCWFRDRSMEFWRRFLAFLPENFTLCLENVLEPEPHYLLDIVAELNDPRIQLCLDLGHCNVYSSCSVEQWICECAPYISHFHIHNNSGQHDEHRPLADGNMDMKQILSLVDAVSPDATCTLELMEASSSMDWLKENDILKE